MYDFSINTCILQKSDMYNRTLNNGTSVPFLTRNAKVLYFDSFQFYGTFRARKFNRMYDSSVTVKNNSFNPASKTIDVISHGLVSQ